MKKQSQMLLKVFVIMLFSTINLIFNKSIVYSQVENTIIADHSVVDQYDQIPDHWINEVKKMLLCVPGESHGRGYIYALELLEALDSRYAVNATWEGEPEGTTNEHLRIIRTYWTGTGWSGSGGEEDFWTNEAAITMMKNHLDYIRNTLNNPVHAFGFGWCWDMTWHNAATEAKDPIYNCGWAGSSVGGPQGDLQWGIDDEDSIITGNTVNLYDYLNAVEEYNVNHPQTITFFTTGPVDSEAWSERGFQRDIKHQVIRQYVNEHGGVLFDYADILTHNDAGEKYEYGSWNGYPVDYIDSENSGNYDGGNGACHIGEHGCLRLGKAMWWMLARIAGWDGSTIEEEARNIVPEDRRIDWDPGIPGGIPYYPVGVNVIDYGALGDSTTDDTQAFLDAIEACPDSHAVLIPAGKYLITGRLSIQKPIAVRGEGPEHTFIIFEKQPDAVEHQRTNFWIGNSLTGFSADVLDGCTFGSSQITVNDVSGFSTGDLVEIRQDNDSTVMAKPGITPEGEYPESWLHGSWGWRAVGQFLIITEIDVTNNTISFHRPLYYTYNLNMNPEITRYTNTIRNAGVEDLSIELVVDANGYYGNFHLDNTVNCWIKNVYSLKCSRSHVGIWGGLGNVIRDSYFEYSHGYAGGQGYGVNITNRSTDNLVENNIFDYLQAKMITGVGVCGNVFGYNYGRRTLDDLGDWAVMHADMSAHGHHAYMNLFEGNSTNNAHIDSYWGSNSNYIFLRNRMLCPDGYAAANSTVHIEKNNPYMSFLGNVLHHENSIERNEVWRFPDEPDDFSDTMLTMNTLIMHGNYDFISENTQWDSDIENHNVPYSYYLNKKPDFFVNAPWGNTQWPIIGPDLLYAGIIPAQQRFCNLNGISIPDAPSNVSAIVSNNQITLSWIDNSDNEDGFRIEQSLNNVDFERIAAVMPDTTSFTLTGLNPNTIYYFRICGFHHISGNSLYSDTVITTTQDAEPVELIAWYKFDGNASDSSGNNYNGNVNGAILSSSILDQAYRFDGVDDFIHIPRWDPDGWRPLHSPIHGDHQAFTLVAWINPDVVMDKNNLIIADDSQWGDFFFGLQDKSIILAFIHNSVDGGNQRYSTITDESVVVNEETFSHIAVTYEPINKAVTIYLNGNQVMVDRISRPLGPSGFDSLYIGRGGALSGGIHFFDGIIDDVRIYKSCLSSKDVYEIYLEGLPPESNPPTTPEILSATAVSEFQINLTWSESEDESGIAEYLIFRNDSLIAQIKGQSYSDSNLLEYETYAYVIVAVDNFGNRSEDSPEVTVTTLDITAPSVPQNLISTNVTGSQIELFWFSSTDNDGIAGYNLYRNDTILIQVEDTSYSDTSVNDATSYIYKVQAIDNSGNESGFSNEVTETTLDVTAPSVPQNLSGSAISGNQINLEWDASTDNVGVTGYNIYRDNEMITTINGTNYSDIGLMPNTEYFYQVSASDEAGNESDLSVAITVTTLDVTEINEMNYAEFNKLYPNPANSEIIIELGTNQIINFELFDLCGIKIIEQEIYPGNNNINISTLINGMYIYKIFYGNENYKHGTLILSHD